MEDLIEEFKERKKEKATEDALKALQMIRHSGQSSVRSRNKNNNGITPERSWNNPKCRISYIFTRYESKYNI